MAERYGQDWEYNYADMIERDNGPWVKYEDYAKLADLCGRLAVLLEMMSKVLPETIHESWLREIKTEIAKAEEVLK